VLPLYTNEEEDTCCPGRLMRRRIQVLGLGASLICVEGLGFRV
jgi:hypothetical protein